MDRIYIIDKWTEFTCGKHLHVDRLDMWTELYVHRTEVTGGQNLHGECDKVKGRQATTSGQTNC